jgi:hypothetical protein
MRNYFVYLCLFILISCNNISYQNTIIKNFIETALNIKITPSNKCFGVVYTKLIKDALRLFESCNYVDSFYTIKTVFHDIKNNCNYPELTEIYKRIIKYIISNSNKHLENYTELHSKLTSITTVIEHNNDIGIIFGKSINILFNINNNKDDSDSNYALMNTFKVSEFINGTVIALENNDKETKHLCLNEIETNNALIYNVCGMLWNDFLHRQEILAVNLRLIFNLEYYTNIPKYCRLIELIDIICNNIINKNNNIYDIISQFNVIITKNKMIITKSLQLMLHAISHSNSYELGIALGIFIKVLFGFYVL